MEFTLNARTIKRLVSSTGTEGGLEQIRFQKGFAAATDGYIAQWAEVAGLDRYRPPFFIAARDIKPLARGSKNVVFDIQSEAIVARPQNGPAIQITPSYDVLFPPIRRAVTSYSQMSPDKGDHASLDLALNADYLVKFRETKNEMLSLRLLWSTDQLAPRAALVSCDGSLRGIIMLGMNVKPGGTIPDLELNESGKEAEKRSDLDHVAPKKRGPRKIGKKARKETPGG